MKAYLAIKFHEDMKNKELIQKITKAIDKAGHETTVIVRDHEQWGEVTYESKELMKLTFKVIDESDLFIVDLSEKGVGLGIESGYAFVKNKPIIIVAKQGSDISKTLKGIASKVIFYKEPSDLTNELTAIT